MNLFEVVEQIRGFVERNGRVSQRMLRRQGLFQILMVLNIVIAISLGGYFTAAGAWTEARAVILLLILLAARANLRQLRSTRLLRKLTGTLH